MHASARVCSIPEKVKFVNGVVLLYPTDDVKLLPNAAVDTLERMYRPEINHGKTEVLLFNLCHLGEDTDDYFAVPQDTISDSDHGYVATETLRFGAGIAASDITTRRVGSDLVFMHTNGTDRVTVKNWFDDATSSAGVLINRIIERVEFADGTAWTWAGLRIF